MKRWAAVALLYPALAGAYGLPACWPEQIGGQGKGFMTWDPQDGTGLCRGGWWCPLPDGTWTPYRHCTIAKYKDMSWQLYWQQATQAPTLADGATSLIRALEVKPAPGPETDALSALYAGFLVQLNATRPADIPPPPPPPPPFVVDVGTDATKTTRPAYPFVNGVRGTTSTARATSGQPCKPEVAQAPSGAASTVYAAYGPAFSPALVALCRKQ